MKNHVWSLKLAAAVGILVASVALAEQQEKSNSLGVENTEDFQVIELKKSDAPESSAQVQADQVLPFDAPGSMLTTDLWNDVAPARVKLPKYRIGVSCAGPLPEVLQEQLNIPKKQGVMVMLVLPDSPAAKAGLRKYDILLAGNDRPVSSVVDLIEIIEKADGKSVTFTFLRKGKKTTVEITPEENPDSKTNEPATVNQPPYPELDRLMQWFEQNHPRGARQSMRLRFMHPGMILPPDALMHPSLPGGMRITIVKQGDQPTRITVKRGEDEWNVDEKGIAELPDDIRPHVERMLHGMVVGPNLTVPRFDFVPDWHFPDKAPDTPRAGPSIRNRLDERMDRMNEQIERLRELIERSPKQQGPEEEK